MRVRLRGCAAAVAAACCLCWLRPVEGAGPSAPQVRRITAEWKQACEAGLNMAAGARGTAVGNATELVRLMPHPRNMFEWHFTFAGPPGTDYEGGLYHGKIELPADYPNSAPSVRLLTPNGRFKANAKICLSASEFHQETWTSAWTIRTLVTALRTHMIVPPEEIGGMHASRALRRLRARQSRDWRCPFCSVDHRTFPAELFPGPPERSADGGADGEEGDGDVEAEAEAVEAAVEGVPPGEEGGEGGGGGERRAAGGARKKKAARRKGAAVAKRREAGGLSGMLGGLSVAQLKLCALVLMFVALLVKLRG